MSRYDLELVRAAARGQWLNILPSLTGLDPALLDRRGHPCPNPGCPSGPGRDRFSCRDPEEGRLFCRYCNATGPNTMDGFGAVQWLTGMTFPEAIEAVAELLGLPAADERPSERKPLIEIVALSKGVRVEELIRFGAQPDVRRDDGAEHPVIRFPMFTDYANGQWVPGSHFDLGIATTRLRKGKAAYGRPPGLFLPWVERDGRKILWKPHPGQKVYLVEGVKDAAKLLELGYPVLGLPYSTLPNDLYGVFRGMDVVVIPDRDRPGLKGANRTAGLLHGHAKSIRIAHLPSPVKPDDGDGVREIARRPDGAKDIRAAVQTAVAWTPDSLQEQSFVTLPEATIRWLERQEQGDQKIVPIGISLVDEALGGGILQGELVVVGARPSHGKSAIALSIAEALARQGETSLFVSEEMEPELLGKRWLTSVVDGPLNSYDPRELIHQVKHDYPDMDRVLISGKLQQVEKVVEAMEYARQQHGATSCLIDYAQILDAQSKRTDYDKITEVSKQLAHAAKRTGMTTFVLCQLSRECEKRGNPVSTDLKGSGQLEQDADVIMLLWYPFMISRQADERLKFEIHIAKNRNRGVPPQAKIELDFHPERMRFADPRSRQAIEHAQQLSFEEEARRG